VTDQEPRAPQGALRRPPFAGPSSTPGVIGYLPSREFANGYPIVVFTPLADGWAVHPHHHIPSRRTSCADLNATYTDTNGQTGAVLVNH
jgi:hypothetical protein